MSSVSNQMNPSRDLEPNWQETDPWIRFGKTIVMVFFIGLFLWSALISISSAVITHGTVTVESGYQDIQSLDGGIVVEIPVKSGELVEKGQTLLKLDDTAARTNMNAIKARVNDMLIKEARLVAERDGANTFAMPSAIQVGDREAGKSFSAQMALFATRKKIRKSNQLMLSERLIQLEGELSGLRAQRKARVEQRQINENELKTVMPLFKRGYVSQQRLSPLKRESARLAGEIGRLDADLQKTTSALQEARLRKKQNDKQFVSDVVDELGRVQASLAEEKQSLERLKSVLAHTTITSPRRGHVHALAVNTIGGVVRPGAQLMQVIPEGERLVIEARLAPRELDRVKPGQTSAIRFSAFDARTTPRLIGKVSKISPAEQKDPNGRAYFTARIDIPTTELAKISNGHRLVPGMPAEVFIETRSRSILSYLLKPLTDSMAHALRER